MSRLAGRAPDRSRCDTDFHHGLSEAIAVAFEAVLLLAREPGLLRVGTVSVDGTKVDANANRRNSIRHDRALELRDQLQEEIGGLLAQAERADRAGADSAGEVKAESLPKELRRLEHMRAKLDEGRATLERRARRRAERERVEYERKLAAREQRPSNRRGRKPKPPSEAPEAKQQVSLVDKDSGTDEEEQPQRVSPGVQRSGGGGR